MAPQKILIHSDGRKDHIPLCAASERKPHFAWDRGFAAHCQARKTPWPTHGHYRWRPFTPTHLV